MSVDANRLTLSNVKKSDTQVVQCNASNVHGYLLANAYLNVQGNNRVWTAVVRNKLITVQVHCSYIQHVVKHC